MVVSFFGEGRGGSTPRALYEITYRVADVARIPLPTALLSPHAASEASQTAAVVGRGTAHRGRTVDKLRSDEATSRARGVLAVALARLSSLAVVSARSNQPIRNFL